MVKISRATALTDRIFTKFIFGWILKTCKDNWKYLVYLPALFSEFVLQSDEPAIKEKYLETCMIKLCLKKFKSNCYLINT